MSSPTMQLEFAPAAATKSAIACPCCSTRSLRRFYECRNVPVNSVLLMPSREAANAYPKGDLCLAVCGRCGFITNSAFDPRLVEYSGRYEETQAFSPTFNAFQRGLAESLIARQNLRNKRIIEIGCGKGEFLSLLCELGPNDGLGFDPSFHEERNPSLTDRARFVADFYSERYADEPVDCIVCKMTFEHIPDSARFLQMVRTVIGNRLDTGVFFQVPNMIKVLKDNAFWDIYYEHCSYFTPGTLTRLFTGCGFDVTHVETGYEDQYIMLDARPANSLRGQARMQRLDEPVFVRYLTGRFARRHRVATEAWRRRVLAVSRAGGSVAIWGGGSKAVAFLSTTGLGSDVHAVVDINPYKHGYYLPGTGHLVSAPDSLTKLTPDLVIVMNPIYEQEIRDYLQRLHLQPEVACL